MADWIALKNEYVNTDISYRKLAEKYGVSFPTVRDRAKKEKWAEEKAAQRHKVVTVTSQKIAAVTIKKEVDRVTRIINLADRLSDKLEESIEQLDTYIVRNKVKVKEVEYNDETAIGKPTREVITETETVEVEQGNIDRQGLKLLTAALKDLKEIQTSSEVDKTEEEDDNFYNAVETAVKRLGGIE